MPSLLRGAGPHSGTAIEEYLKPRQWFRGLLSGDAPPRQWQWGGYVVNLDDSAGPGTHWTAIWVDPGKFALYYDPAGYPPPRLLFESLTGAGIRTIYSTTQSQQEGFDCGRRSALALEALAAAEDPVTHFVNILAA